MLAVIYAAPAGYSARKFDDPVGMHVDSNNILYVAEWYNNSSVCMFTTSGEFLGYVGGGSRFKYPTFITSDQSGRLYISDDNGVNNYLQVLPICLPFPLACSSIIIIIIILVNKNYDFKLFLQHKINTEGIVSRGKNVQRNRSLIDSE